MIFSLLQTSLPCPNRPRCDGPLTISSWRENEPSILLVFLFPGTTWLSSSEGHYAVEYIMFRNAIHQFVQSGGRTKGGVVLVDGHDYNKRRND